MRQTLVAALTLLWATLTGCQTRPPSGPALSVRHETGADKSKGISIVLSGLGADALTRAKGLPPGELSTFLALYVGADIHSPHQPPVAGTYRFEEGRIILRPLYPLQPGLSYHATANPVGLDSQEVRPAPLLARFIIPALPHRPKQFVAHVYPTTDVLPENLLKFYLYFSGPMSRGGIYQFIKLLNADGTAVDLPFLEIGEELWDRDLTRLTLLIDPGRIKREINPLENLGPALLAGREYTLVIDAAWPDATGASLRTSHRKHFRVVAPDRTAPDPKRWRIETPKSESRRPLVLEFGEPMDRALALRLIRVRSAAGVDVHGTVRLRDQEGRWEFAPDQAWRKEEYQIVVEKILEDLAGNTIGKPFEVDMEQPIDPEPPTTLRFRPRL